MLSLLLAAATQNQQVTIGDGFRLTNVVSAYASWSPDGAKIVYQANPGGNFDLYVVGSNGAAPRLIVQSPAADITPVWSPDGNTIAFVSERDGDREIYLCDGNGGNLRRLTREKGNDIHPVWSADGRTLMFSSNRGNADPEDFDIYTMKADGSGLKQITKGPEVDTYASWSPDGKRIVTRRVIAGNNEVFVMDADGANPKNLTSSPNYDGWPVWSPDGQWIAYASGPIGGNHKIYLMKPDGTNRVELTKESREGEFVYCTQPCFSPDGKRLIYTSYRMGIAESADLIVRNLNLPRPTLNTPTLITDYPTQS